MSSLTVRTPEGRRQIALQPAPILSCEMALAVGSWLEVALQPLTRGSFSHDIESLRVGGGHECRGRNRSSSGPLSSHSNARALDIFAFKLTGKPDDIVVEKPGGLDQARYLDAVRMSACGAFATVLGPGSDAAHANHLHVDIETRRSRASRFCQ